MFSTPVWMAFPPETHSTLLSAGPGPGPLVAAAAAWSALSAEYETTADDLATVLASVRAGAWNGPSAARYLAAHSPYLAWLLQAALDAAAVAVAHRSSAAAFATALSTMPTPAELAANHAIHTTLVATNFFGLNTVPISLNEADYVRMWIQAAWTMATYHGAAGAAAIAAPRTAMAPPVMGSGGETGGGGHMGGGPNTAIPGTAEEWLNAIFPPKFDPFGPLPDMYPSLQTFLPRVEKMLAMYAGDPGQLAQAVFLLGTQFVVHRAMVTINLLLHFPQLLAMPLPQLVTALTPIVELAAGPAVAGALAAPAVGGPAGTSGLAGLSGLANAAPSAPAPTPAPDVATAPVSSGAAAAGPPPAPMPTPAPGTPPITASPGPPPVPPLLGSEGTLAAQATIHPYLLGVVSAAAKTPRRAQQPQPTPDATAAPAPDPVTAARRQPHPTHRGARRQGGRGYRYEFLDPQASERGTHRLGFTGTAVRSVPSATGLTARHTEPFGSGPRLPILPATWPDNPEVTDR